MFIPGSHKLGVLDAQHDTSTTSYPLWVITNETITSCRARRHRRAQGAAGLDDPFPRLPGARLDLEPLAWNRVSVYCRSAPCRTTSAASSGRTTLRTGISLRSSACRTIVCSRTTTWRFLEGTGSLNLYAKLRDREEQGKPLRIA